jgi:hypothetical protein
MTHDTRTADEIERDIQRERAQMSDSINNLQEKFSVDSIVNDLGNMFRTQGEDLSRTFSQTVGRNPAAVALVGVGLAWLIIGRNHSEDVDDDWRDRGRYGRGSGEWQGRSDMRSRHGMHTDHDRHWFDGDHAGRSRDDRGGMRDKLHDTADTVRDKVSQATSGISNAASDLTERLSQGLEDLSEAARERVVAARRKAHDARVASGSVAQRGRDSASDFFESQPLVVGGLALAFGAALGGVLPHSRIEDETMGASSDRLYAEAEELFRAEREKAMKAARSAATEVKNEIGAAKESIADLLPDDKSVGDVIVDRASGVVSRALDQPETKTGDPSPDKPRA